MGQGGVIEKEKVKYPYYASKIIFKDGMKLEGIILASNESSLFLISKKDWRKIKGKKPVLPVLQEVMSKKGIKDWPRAEITYRSLGMVETKEIKGPSNMRWVGLGFSVFAGVLIAKWANSIDCGDNGDCNLNEGIVTVGAVFGGIGFGIGSLFSIRFPRKKQVQKVGDAEWQQALLEYSVLR